MSKVHLSIKTIFGRPKGGHIRQVSLYPYIAVLLSVFQTVALMSNVIYTTKAMHTINKNNF